MKQISSYPSYHFSISIPSAARCDDNFWIATVDGDITRGKHNRGGMDGLSWIISIEDLLIHLISKEDLIEKQVKK